MVSSSCSTTSRVFPRSRRSCMVFSSISLSLWCRPMDGSSRIYSTPMREEPICVARRMRWLSPPDRVPAPRDRVRYCRPTDWRKPSRLLISFKMRSAMRIWTSVSSRWSTKSRAWVTDLRQKASMSSPPTVTARDSFRRRRP